MTIIEEHFETWPTAGWSIINHGGDCVWQSTATTDRLNDATFSGEAAVADSDWCGVMSSMNTERMTPLLNLSAYSQASLDFVIASQSAGCSLFGCAIDMPSNDFGPGDECYCNVTVCDTDSFSCTDIPVFVVLDVAGAYFFAPDFSEFGDYTMTLPPGETVIPVLPSFDWPAGVGAFSGVNGYVAMTNPEMTALHGALDIFTFGWH